MNPAISMMAMAAATITAARAGCGISASAGRTRSSDAARNTAATTPTSCVWLASEAGNGSAAGARRDRKALGEAGRHVVGTEGGELLIGVDPIVQASGDRPARPSRGHHRDRSRLGPRRGRRASRQAAQRGEGGPPVSSQARMHDLVDDHASRVVVVELVLRADDNYLVVNDNYTTSRTR